MGGEASSFFQYDNLSVYNSITFNSSGTHVEFLVIRTSDLIVYETIDFLLKGGRQVGRLTCDEGSNLDFPCGWLSCPFGSRPMILKLYSS